MPQFEKLSDLQDEEGLSIQLDRVGQQIVILDGQAVVLAVNFEHAKNEDGDLLANDLESNAPPQDPYLAMLEEWERVSLRLAQVKEHELNLRLTLFAGAFPNPREGTNTHNLPDGRALKGQHKINRTIDEAALPSTLAAMRAAGVANTDKLVRFKPELAKAEWNTLSEEMRLLFSPAVISSPGTPQFEVVIPKRRGRS